MLIRSSDLEIVDSLHIRQIRTQAGIRKRPVLSHGLLLDRAEISERVWAWVIVVSVPPNESAQAEYRSRTEESGPRGRDVESLNLRALVGCRKRIAEGVGLTDMQVVERIRILEPRSRESQIQVNGVGRG